MLGSWYLAVQKPDPPVSTRQQTLPAGGSSQAQALSPPVSPPASLPAEQKTAGARTLTSSTFDPLPSFIPRAGHDREYAAGNPGWERYSGKQFDFKVFRSEGTLKAVQVIARNSRGIPASFMDSVLTELAGSPNFRISSRENRSGFLVLKGVANEKGDLILYKKGGAVRAFVVSLR